MMNYNAPSMGTYGSTWQASGYSGAGNVKSLINSNRNRPAVVAGSARGVFEELEIVRSVYGPDDLLIFAVNDTGMYLPRLHHWVSLHDKHLLAWRAVRYLYDVDKEVPTRIHTYESSVESDYSWVGLNPIFALSGYFAMQIAYLMGCLPIILVGCPGDGTPRFFEHSRADKFGYGSGLGPSDKGIRQQIEHECSRVPNLKASVRSLSGWTAEFFGGI